MMNDLCGLICVVCVAAIIGCESDPQADSAPAERPAAEVAPIVDASAGQLFGASRGEEWLTATEAASHVSDGQEYRLYGLTDSYGARWGSGVESPDETCTNPAVDVADLPDAHQDLLGVVGAWDVQLRVPAVQDTTQQTYRRHLAEYLEEHGIEADTVPLDQVLRVDLEGDGVEEVILVSNRLRGSETMAMAGDHAVVLLRTVIEDEVRQIPLEAEYYAEECIGECVPSSFRVTNVLDLNGDGVLEVVTGFEYFEGRGKRIHAVDGEDTEVVLSWRCGV
jgi:hypothetical protein